MNRKEIAEIIFSKLKVNEDFIKESLFKEGESPEIISKNL